MRECLFARESFFFLAGRHIYCCVLGVCVCFAQELVFFCVCVCFAQELVLFLRGIIVVCVFVVLFLCVNCVCVFDRGVGVIVVFVFFSAREVGFYFARGYIVL